MMDNLYEFCTSKWALFKHSWRVYVCLFNELDFDLKSLESIFSCILTKKFRLDRQMCNREDNFEKSRFSAFGDFFSANEQWPISVKALLHRGLLLAQRLFFIYSDLFFCFISPRILRILTGYYDRPCSSSFVVVRRRSSSFVVRCNDFLCPPMISLNG